MKRHENLGTVKNVELREVWPHEAHDFTTWLADADNLSLLSKAVGIDLELIETESPVGSFSVDIFAEESGTGRKVVIENQLENTNHDHLGKVITYAAGKNAEVLIWLVAHARDEHRQAIEWLNRYTDSNIGFFLVEIELLRIGDSLPAPRFNVIEEPNEWAKSVKLSESLNDTERIKLEYWTQFREIAWDNPEFLKVFTPRKPSKNHWSTLSCGTSAYHLSLLIDTQLGRCGIEFYVPDNKEIGDRAVENKKLFESRLDMESTSVGSEKTTASGLRFYKSGCDIKNKRDQWPAYIEDQITWALEMKKLIDELRL